jgi:hypothetical protein
MRAIMKMEEQRGFDWRLIKRVVVTLLPALGIIVVGIFFIVSLSPALITKEDWLSLLASENT